MSNLEMTFKILAAVFIGLAAVFLWLENRDGTFVSAVLGCICFFLSIRFQVKQRVDHRAAELRREKEIDETE